MKLGHRRPLLLGAIAVSTANSDASETSLAILRKQRLCFRKKKTYTAIQDLKNRFALLREQQRFAKRVSKEVNAHNSSFSFPAVHAVTVVLTTHNTSPNHPSKYENQIAGQLVTFYTRM